MINSRCLVAAKFLYSLDSKEHVKVEKIKKRAAWITQGREHFLQWKKLSRLELFCLDRVMTEQHTSEP